MTGRHSQSYLRHPECHIYSLAWGAPLVLYPVWPKRLRDSISYMMNPLPNESLDVQNYVHTCADREVILLGTVVFIQQKT